MPRVTRVEGRAVHGAALHHWLATTSTSSAALLFELAVMMAAKGASVANHIKRGGMIHVRASDDMIADKASCRSAARYDAAPAIAVMGGALERFPVRGIVVAIAGQRLPRTSQEHPQDVAVSILLRSTS